MRALRYHGREDVRIDDIDEPEVRPGTVGVEVHANGLCGSDLHEYQGGPIFIPDDEPHPLTGETLPVVMGHEFAGEVYAVGVLPSAQGRGLGASLTLAGIEYLRSRDVDAVILYVDASNASAAALYKKLGFRVWDIDIQYAPVAERGAESA